MLAIQVLAPPTVAEEVRNVLSACRHERNADGYARQLVRTLADVTGSQYAVWLNPPQHPACVVAETDQIHPLIHRLILDASLPLLDNQWDLCASGCSIAAAPVQFRGSAVGVLAIVNSSRPYTSRDVEMLEQAGSLAAAEYESLKRAENLANLVHGLRQPLGILEACAFLLDMSLPAGDTRAREQLAEMLRQLERASGILDESTESYAPLGSRPRPEETAPEESESLVLTNSAMSMVT
jgi:hypothetical protein